jgi:hypothetical protein
MAVVGWAPGGPEAYRSHEGHLPHGAPRRTPVYFSVRPHPTPDGEDCP